MTAARLTRLGGAIAAAAVLLPVTAAAQGVVEVPTQAILDADDYAPPVITRPQITLAEAVDLALRQSATLRRTAERVRAAAGRYRQARGAFDTGFTAGASLEMRLQQLTPFLRGREVSKRDAIENVAEEFTELTTILRDIIAEVPTIPPRCPSSLQFTLADVRVERRDDLELAVLGVDEDLRSQVTADLNDTISGFDLGDICSTPIDPLFTPDAFNGALRKIDQAGGLGLGGVLTSVAQIPREIRLLQEEIAHTVALRAKLALDRLGPVPDDDLRRTFGLNAGLTKPFRNGLLAGVTYEIQSREHNFVDKPLDPSFGALGVPAQFYSSLSGTFTMPLARGRGRVSAGAPEQAAEHILAGERDALRHGISADVFRTVLAYLNLVAAQETVRLLEESAARMGQIATVTQQRVDAGAIPGFEVGRAQARAAAVATQAAQARTAQGEARIALAEAMGVSVAALGDAPLAADSFAAVQAAVPSVTDLAGNAREFRRDLRAAGYRHTAASILAEGARADARPRLDLSVTAGISNLYESPFFRYLPDEREAIINQTATLPIASVAGSPVPREDPVRYWAPRGYFRSASGRHEPFVTVNLTWDVPFGNNQARGRAAQAEATRRSSSIEVVDLARVINENVIGVRGALERAGMAVAASQDAVDRGNELLAAVLQQLQDGDVTVLDALRTEEDVTGDLLQLVRRRQAYLSTLARLRYESGGLVGFDGVGTDAEIARFQTTDFVVR